MDNITKQTLVLFWQVISKDKKDLYKSLFFPFSLLFTGVIIPYVVSMLLAKIITEQNLDGGLMVILVLSILAGVITNFVGFTAYCALQAKSYQELMGLTLKSLLKRSTGFHADNISGNTVNNAVNLGTALDDFLTGLYTQALGIIITVTIGISLILYKSWELGLALIVLVLVMTAMTVRDNKVRYNLRMERKKLSTKMVQHYSDTIVGAVTAKTFAREPYELKKHHAMSLQLQKAKVHDWTITGRNASIRLFVTFLTQVVFIIVLAYIIKNNPDALGIGLFAFSYTLTLSLRILEVGNIVRRFEEAFLRAAPMVEVLVEQPEVVDEKGAKDINVTSGQILVEDVSFAYASGGHEQAVFNQLTFMIGAGQKIGLVGPSGGGKSTLTRLLLRFDDVQDGRIMIDGQDIAKVTQSSLHRAISYVPQEPLLFHRSIRENIAYGKLGVTENEIIEAATKAHAHDFINELPEGYDTIVGERGVKLSGGQRQRIAIARAIVKDAPVLILDEATSALDSESEKYIQDALKILMKDKTTIVIAHRLSTIQEMDNILVIDNGKIVESGTHSRLKTKNGLYAKLWLHQTDGFM